MLCSLDRRRALATIASGAIALGLGAGRAHAEGNHVLEAAAEIGRLLSASNSASGADVPGNSSMGTESA